MDGRQRTTADIERLFEELYNKHARPLEQEHRGEYIAVSEDGKVVLGGSRAEAAERAQEKLGPGVFLYKLGERSVGKWRCATTC